LTPSGRLWQDSGMEAKDTTQGAALAAGIRLDAKDVAEGVGPWRGVLELCRSCERRTRNLEDGWCAECNRREGER